MELSCSVQQYAWGKVGLQSEVAVLKSSSDATIVVDENAPYAELWMGTHPNGPSILKSTKSSLEEWISSHPECLGKKTRERFGDQLPFLFKVLSVEKALSIQAHPNKAHAEILHKESPDVYKDPNHKPEIAIALTPFEALCGFRPMEEIKNFLKSIEELRQLIGEDVVLKLINGGESETEAALKACFTELMKCPDELVAVQSQAYLSQLSTMDGDQREKKLASLFERLHTQFPGDVGCFVIYFLNYVKLLPGEAVFLGPNIPHAYIYGDCIECMACSDNVVRAGLTPKFRDVKTLCEMLNYQCGGSVKFTDVQKLDQHTTLFSPPIEDFAVSKIELTKSCHYKLIPKETASICIVIKGQFVADTVTYKRGSVFFLEANKSLQMDVNDEGGLLMFQAFCNI
ncbi:mannose-6-phosphate isomerase [Ischnura elegans]|uniref:mannose-6-phosphate isomerase n=1 Tax=Ischnura elegans TaxID=197161 RepID=UPI001ED8BAC3|nr:mannose-6-phosphate isomerase [Ischnura elegans]XP_046383478.1 mannose-6-phosphate isomerase [Ischnura elegans]